jgi:integral membrane protein (TIGR01906 family)
MANAVLPWLATITLTLLIVTTNVRFTANSIAVYEELFERNQVTRRTGITEEGLRSVGTQIQDYFNSDTEPLVVLAEVNGVERSLFGADEASHMADVKVLFLRTYRLQEASALFLAVAVIGVLVLRRRRGLLDIASWMRRGAITTIVTIAVLGIGSVVAFDQVFELFHQLGFPQGNFRFNTNTDYLVRVFPFGFWQEITLLIGALSLIQAALLLITGFWGPRLGRRLLAGRSTIREGSA